MKIDKSLVLKIGFTVLVIICGFIFQIRKNKQYNSEGVKTEGIIIKCKMKLRNGACNVTVEYFNEEGERKEFETSLYDNTFCIQGKKVPVIYLPNGDAKVDEHVGFFGPEDENGNLKE